MDDAGDIIDDLIKGLLLMEARMREEASAQRNMNSLRVHGLVLEIAETGKNHGQKGMTLFEYVPREGDMHADAGTLGYAKQIGVIVAALQGLSRLDHAGEVIRSCGADNTYERSNRRKTTRIWFHIAGYIVLEGDDLHGKKYMQAEVVIGKALTSLGGTKLGSTAQRGAVAYKLAKPR